MIKFSGTKSSLFDRSFKVMSCPHSVPNQTAQDDGAENHNTPVHSVQGWVVLLGPK